MTTRRDLLAGCGVVVAGSLAGCSALPFVGGSATGPGSYEDWLPAWSGGFVRFGSQRHSVLAGRSSVSDRFVDDPVFGVDAADVDRYAFFEHDRQRAYVLVSPLSADELTHRLLESERIGGMQSVEAYAGYDRFDVEASDDHVALRNGTVVVGSPPVLESVIDARSGSAERLAAANETAELLIDALADDDRVEARLRLDPDAGQSLLPEPVAGSGTSYSVDGERTEQTYVVVFHSPDETDEAGVRESVASGRNVTVSSSETSGRVVTVTSTVPTASL